MGKHGYVEENKRLAKMLESISKVLAPMFLGLYECIYLMIEKGQIAQKDHIGAKIDLTAKIMGNYMRQAVF